MNPLIYILILLLLPIAASIAVKSTFSKYRQVHSSRGMTADQVARSILDSHGLYNVRIEKTGGSLTDHYDPRDNVVRLSDTVFGSTSVAAIGVAAHECGHAVQHAQEYTPIKVRSAIVPVVSICSHLWYLVFIIGLILFELFPALAYLGAVMFLTVVIFQAVTLPTELDASRRAIETLRANYILDENEIPMAKKVLTAAAFTYIVALVTSLIQLLRILSALKD